MGEGASRGIDPTGKTVRDQPGGPSPEHGGPADDGGAALAGKMFAHYRIERRLGQGGMGDVFLAVDTALDRPVALKVLSQPIADDQAIRARFVREARAQARINHPNVCHIYYTGETRDAGLRPAASAGGAEPSRGSDQTEGRLFFAMEYIEGESLQERLGRDGKIPVDKAVELCRMAALGLREAHRMGFTHRDVKPSNLMVGRNGLVKVVDFGIVKETAREGGDPGASRAGVTIEKGLLLGTPHYMSPEQARGERIDFRSDIYALGATLHHLVAGQPPFSSVNTLGIVAKHLSEPRPRLRGRKRDRQMSAVDDLCDRMMAKRPEDRFASYDDLLSALERVSPDFSRPAGVWVRAFAVALDALVILALSEAVLSIEFGSTLGIRGPLIRTLVAAFYCIVLHGRWGRTPGKAALELELVPTDRAGRIGFSRAAVRWAAEWGSASAAVIGTALADRAGGGDLFGKSPVLFVLLLVLGFVPPLAGGLMTAFNPWKRAIWDVAARTQVRYRRAGR